MQLAIGSLHSGPGVKTSGLRALRKGPRVKTSGLRAEISDLGALHSGP